MKNFLAAICILVLLCPLSSLAQPDATQLKRIDSLFMAWNNPNHPGGAIGIMQNDKIVFSKAYGLASLEYLVPNSPGTIFNTGSVSKQFTAMGIVLLEGQGKLSFDDDIRTYLPELPDFGHTISIRHLLHHTSGLRSLHALFALAGWRGDDSRTNEDLNRIILKQKDLNFVPGDEFLYCNTGYMLMVNIIEERTGENFASWMKQHVFEPLGMYHTYVEDQYDRVVPNNATSYYERGEFKRAVEYWGYVGSGNMHSTTEDLLRWLNNFNRPRPGWQSAFEKMRTLDPFNDGTASDYAFGVRLDHYLGEKRIQHGGSIGGFRAFVSTYPEQHLNIALLTNFSSSNPQDKAEKIAGILLDHTAVNNGGTKVAPAIKLSNKVLETYEGTYWNKREKLIRQVYLQRDTLRYKRSGNNESILLPIEKDRFIMPDADAEVTVDFRKKDGTGTMVLHVKGQADVFFEEKPDTEATEEELSGYVGTFYSPEVETAYTISWSNQKLSVDHPRHGSIPAQREFKDVLSSEWPLGIIEFHRNADGMVDGIYISNGRVRALWFRKQ